MPSCEEFLSVNKVDVNAPNNQNDTSNSTCNDSIINFVNEDENLCNPNLNYNKTNVHASK